MEPTTAARPFGFPDLPPELRNRIYQLLLPDNKGVRIWRFERRLSRSGVAGDLTKLAKLLPSNRQVNEESAPVLYGSLIFEFFQVTAAREWLVAIGAMKQHIRHVQLHVTWNGTTIRPVLHQLKQATSFYLLGLGRGVQARPANEVALDFKPFLKAVRKTHKADVTPVDVLKKIDVYYGKRTDQLEESEGDRKARVAWTLSLREILTKMMTE